MGDPQQHQREPAAEVLGRDWRYFRLLLDHDWSEGLVQDLVDVVDGHETHAVSDLGRQLVEVHGVLAWEADCLDPGSVGGEYLLLEATYR